MKLASFFVWAVAIPVSTFSISTSVGVESANRNAMIERAVGYLKTHGQSEDGSFSSKTGPGVTGLVTAGLLSVDLPATDPLVAMSL